MSRRLGETLLIGDDIKVTLLDIHGRQARVGIEAPEEIPIVREEIADRDQFQAPD